MVPSPDKRPITFSRNSAEEMALVDLLVWGPCLLSELQARVGAQAVRRLERENAIICKRIELTGSNSKGVKVAMLGRRARVGMGSYAPTTYYDPAMRTVLSALMMRFVLRERHGSGDYVTMLRQEEGRGTANMALVAPQMHGEGPWQGPRVVIARESVTPRAVRAMVDRIEPEVQALNFTLAFLDVYVLTPDRGGAQSVRLSGGYPVRVTPVELSEVLTLRHSRHTEVMVS